MWNRSPVGRMPCHILACVIEIQTLASPHLSKAYLDDSLTLIFVWSQTQTPVSMCVNKDICSFVMLLSVRFYLATRISQLQRHNGRYLVQAKLPSFRFAHASRVGDVTLGDDLLNVGTQGERLTDYGLDAARTDGDGESVRERHEREHLDKRIRRAVTENDFKCPLSLLGEGEHQASAGVCVAVNAERSIGRLDWLRDHSARRGQHCLEAVQVAVLGADDRDGEGQLAIGQEGRLVKTVSSSTDQLSGGKQANVWLDRCFFGVWHSHELRRWTGELFALQSVTRVLSADCGQQNGQDEQRQRPRHRELSRKLLKNPNPGLSFCATNGPHGLLMYTALGKPCAGSRCVRRCMMQPLAAEV